MSAASVLRQALIAGPPILASGRIAPTFVPSSACFESNAVCACKSLDLFIHRSPSLAVLRNWDPPAQTGPESGRQVMQDAASIFAPTLPFRASLKRSISCGYITGYIQEAVVGSSQKRAIQNYRSRLSERGLSRFEVLARDADCDLIRSLARRLAEDGPEASRLRAAVSQAMGGAPPRKGDILAALRRSPLVGAELDYVRGREEGRDVKI